MVEPVSRTDPMSGRTTPTQKSTRQFDSQTQPPNLFYAQLSDNRALMDDRFPNRRRNSQVQPSSSSSSGRRAPHIPPYGYPLPEHALNVPPPGYPPPPQPHYAGSNIHSGYYTLPQFPYPHPAYTPDGTPYMHMYQYQLQNRSSEGFSQFSVTSTPSPPSSSSPNPYAAQGAYHPLHVSRVSSPQQYYGYGPYAPSPGYQFYQDGDGQWWYPQQQQQQHHPQQPHYDGEQHYQQHYYPPERFSPAARTEPEPRPPPQPPQPPPAPRPSSPALVPVRPSPPASTPTALNQPSQRQAVRRPYHPNPPAYRSEWVMWAGNVPSDATHDELWRFFTKGPDEPPPPILSSKGRVKEGEEDQVEGAEEEPIHGGVLSIFLISRSSCAFINYKGEAFLRAGIARFNGQSLRPQDTRIPKLVCRVRKREDDLKAGVGGQRGSGMHLRWLKENKKAAKGDLERPPSISSHSSSDSMDLLGPMSALSTGSGEEEEIESGLKARSRMSYNSGSSSSYASTNSSVLARYFPKRFFILKSLTRYDLDLSVQKGLWATQKHNEGILDQAYRNANEVYLIFGVNKSGEFYGYARMAGRIPQPERGSEQSHEQVPWAKRAPPSSTSSTSSRREPLHSVEEEPSTTSATPEIFFDGPVKQSPLPLVGGEKTIGIASPDQRPKIDGEDDGKRWMFQSAPAELQHLRRQVTASTLSPDLSLGGVVSKPSSVHLETAIERNRELEVSNFELNEDAPFDNMRPGNEGSSRKSNLESDHVPSIDGSTVVDGVTTPAPADANSNGPADPRTESWGEPFKVEWLCWDRLPFARTKHIRNPWNHDREVKVSRDGTEIEPTTGQLLLDEWERYRQELAPSSTNTSAQPAQPSGRGRRGGTRGDS